MILSQQQMESLQASLAASEAERLELETLLKNASREAEAASRDAVARVDALKAELEASGREVVAVNEERRQIEVRHCCAAAVTVLPLLRCCCCCYFFFLLVLLSLLIVVVVAVWPSFVVQAVCVCVRVL